jgi:UDP-N-acetyl-D-mannosaminuronic acid transferase (WecB/TagA/CpsF family)
MRQLGTRAGDYRRTEYLYNGGFESEPTATPFDWKVLPVEGVEAGRDSATPHSGQWSLRIRFPGTTNLAYAGYFQKNGSENDAVIEDINAKAPDILYLGFGSPAQEKWIADNMCRVNARVFLPLGAGLDYYTGSKRRGPRWLTHHGAEWICRLILEPKRLWRRYLLGNPLFFLRIAGCVLENTFRRS